MLYYLFQHLDAAGVPGAGVFQYISFRSLMACLLSLIFATVIGRRIIDLLRRQQIGESIRDLGLEGQMQKKGTPTMGGIIIIAAIVVPVLLLCKLDSIYVILMLVTTIWLGLVGFLDDYIKVFKKNKEGLPGRYKIVGQVSLGIVVAATLYFNDEVVVRTTSVPQTTEVSAEATPSKTHQKEHMTKAPVTTIPFISANPFDYRSLANWAGEHRNAVGWLIFAVVAILVVTCVSNGANMTDGLDGLAAGTSAIVGAALAAFAYVSSHLWFADYLNIIYTPNSSELVVFMSSFVGATIGFLWYNSYPAQVFMGDTGSLTIGGIIAVLALLIHIEWLIPLLCGIFLVEDLSVILQVSYFKYTKRKFGEGRRIFLMAPIHHHFQKKGVHETKIVVRFWMVSILLAFLTLMTLKLR